MRPPALHPLCGVVLGSVFVGTAANSVNAIFFNSLSTGTHFFYISFAYLSILTNFRDSCGDSNSTDSDH